MKHARLALSEGPVKTIRWQGVRPVLDALGHRGGHDAFVTNVNKETRS